MLRRAPGLATLLSRSAPTRHAAAAVARPHALRWARRCCASQADGRKALLEAHGLEDRPGLPEPAALEARLDFLRSIGVQSIARAVERHPSLLDSDVETMRPRLQYLVSLGIHEIGPMVERAPALLSCDVRRDLHRKVVILQTLGLRRVARWLRKNPGLVDVDVEGEIRPTVELLRSVRGLALPRVMDALTTDSFRSTATLEARLGYLRELLGDGERLGAAITAYPRLLFNYGSDSLRAKVAWLTSAGFADPGAMVAREPRLLGMAVETNLEPKLRYLLADMGRTVEEVEQWPQVLNYSLEHLRSRHAFLELHGVASKHSLGRMYRTSLRSLCTRLAKQPVQELGSPDGRPRVPMNAVENWLQRRATLLAADEARGAALAEMRQLVAMPPPATDPDAGVNAGAA